MEGSSDSQTALQSSASQRQAPYPAKKAPWPTPFTGAIIALFSLILLSFQGAKKEERSPQCDTMRLYVAGIHADMQKAPLLAERAE